MLRLEFASLHSRLPTRWSRSYYAGSIGAGSEAVVRCYIEAQKGVRAMKLVAAVRLLPGPEQADLLRTTLERCNAACEWLAQIAHDTGTRRQYDLHKLAYAEMRVRFGLSAQAAVRCIGKVADSLKAGDKEARRRFHRHAAQPYDERIAGFCRARTPYRSGRSPGASASHSPAVPGNGHCSNAPRARSI